MMKYAEVAVDVRTGYDRTFTYSFADDMGYLLGHLVLVPFGPRLVPGVVFDVGEISSSAYDLREISSIIHPEPVLRPYQLELSRWMSEYYMASLFECASLMFPPGFRIKAKNYLSLAESQLEVHISAEQQLVLEFVKQLGQCELQAVIKAFGHKVSTHIRYLVEMGLLESRWEWQKQSIRPKYETMLNLSISQARAEDISNSILNKAPRQAKLLQDLVASGKPMALSDVGKKFGYSVPSALKSKKWIHYTNRHVERDPLDRGKYTQDFSPYLNTQQSDSLNRIVQAIDDGKHKVFLVNGVTGSGKTEIYLNALEYVISKGGRGIAMVPEISLTPQVIERFESRFPNQVAVLHSGLSRGEQFDQWWAIHKGQYGIVVGSRSAIFGPQPNLKLIIIDEEHEWTYKQQDVSPRYHSRDVAIKLGELTQSIVILGSATPDVVSYNAALKRGDTILRLPHRISVASDKHGGVSSVAPLPDVRVVDLKAELRDGNKSIFSRALYQGIKSSLDAEKQIILYINRRGSAGIVECRDCGYSIACRRCNVTLNYHGQTGILVCHYCNYRVRPPAKCSRCTSARIRYLGLGTQKVVDEVHNEFPGATVLRWDRDTATNLVEHEKQMRKFSNGEAQILVGTQMIAKGHHFPNVALVGVLCADIGLFVPDFRAGEKAFQILCQVSGRAGRGTDQGEVVIQTYNPDHYAVLAAAEQNYDQFFEKEMNLRKELSAPPFSKYIRLLYLDRNMDRCEREAKRFAQRLNTVANQWGLNDIDILGPAPAYPTRQRGLYRWSIMLRGVKPKLLLDKIYIPQGWLIDVDPQSMA